jgi:hypothetical protein
MFGENEGGGGTPVADAFGMMAVMSVAAELKVLPFSPPSSTLILLLHSRCNNSTSQLYGGRGPLGWGYYADAVESGNVKTTAIRTVEAYRQKKKN